MRFEHACSLVKSRLLLGVRLGLLGGKAEIVYRGRSRCVRGRFSLLLIITLNRVKGKCEASVVGTIRGA